MSLLYTIFCPDATACPDDRLERVGTMESAKKKRYLFAAPAVLVLYLLIAAEPIRRELVLSPAWLYEIAPEPAEPGRYVTGSSRSSESVAFIRKAVPFLNAERFGYLTPEGRLVGAGRRGYGVALSSYGFAQYDKHSLGFTVVDPSGKVSASLGLAGFPFFSGERRFLMRPDQSGILEFDARGKTVWEKEFPSIITCFAATKSVALAGLLDGRVLAIGNEGQVVLEHLPGGSRIPAVYGVALSKDGARIAVISGLDRQTVSILEKRQDGYQEIRRLPLNLELRRQIPCVFLDEGRTLVFERAGGIAVLDIEAGNLDFRPSEAMSSAFELPSSANGAFFLSNGSGNSRLIGFGARGRALADITFAYEDSWLHAETSSLYLTTASSVMRLDLEAR